MTEDWEQSFLPLNDPRAVPPPSLVPENLPPAQCLNCSKAVEHPLYVVKHFARNATKHLAFCDILCHELYYLHQLRGNGL